MKSKQNRTNESAAALTLPEGFVKDCTKQTEVLKQALSDLQSGRISPAEAKESAKAAGGFLKKQIRELEKVNAQKSKGN